MAGLDKFKVSLHLRWKNAEFLPMLSGFRDQLRLSEKENIPCDSIEFLDGMRFNMRPYGASKYPYVLDSGDITLLFSNHKPGAQFPNCRIEIGSMSCWHPGWLDLYEKITGWLRDQGAVIERQKLTAFDITVDLLGVRFGDTDFSNRRRWIARCNKGNQAFGNWKDNYISLGKGDCMFKCYNKTGELDPMSAKYDFFHDLWRDHTGDDVEHVTRLEFQFRRPKIKELGIKSVSDLSQKLNSVWAYCVGGGEEGNGWCRFVDCEIAPEDRENKNQQRYSVDALWAAVRSVRFGEGRTFRLVRDKTQHVDIERLTKMVAGCVSSLCGAVGLHDDDLESHINFGKYLLEEQMRNNYSKDRKEYRRKIQTKYNTAEIIF
ncbi:MAG: hypothetical protein D3906_12290 [Candidatus Electrothrix sp. AUS1_2]|nr:hypothetical protein [Candidatus Electrothrix sp. AUS1_2]